MIGEKIEITFKESVKKIIEKIETSQLEIFQNANQSILELYFFIGKIIEDNIE